MLLGRPCCTLSRQALNTATLLACCSHSLATESLQAESPFSFQPQNQEITPRADPAWKVRILAQHFSTPTALERQPRAQLPVPAPRGQLLVQLSSPWCYRVSLSRRVMGGSPSCVGTAPSVPQPVVQPTLVTPKPGASTANVADAGTPQKPAVDTGPVNNRGMELDPLQDLIMDKDLARDKYPAAKIGKEKAALAEGKHCSLMAEYVSEQMFDKLKELTSGGLGEWTIARAINAGVQFPRADMGIHAGDPESYDTFIDIYRPCVERYHTGFKWDAQHAQRTDLNADHVTEEISDLASRLIVSSRIRVVRNLAAPFAMNPNGTAQTRTAVLDTVRQCAATFPPDLEGTMYAHADMTAAEEQQLIDNHILFKGRDAGQAAGGYHMYWPAGRGVFCSKDKTFNMWINEGDHLRIICLFQGSDIKGVLRKLASGIAAMEAAIIDVTGNASPIAKHTILGYVTCCPTNLGTGLRASVRMDLPRLMKQLGLQGIDKVCAENHCEARGTTGEVSDVAESTRCDISNRYRLGYSEAELVAQMIRTANLLAKMETSPFEL